MPRTKSDLRRQLENTAAVKSAEAATAAANGLPYPPSPVETARSDISQILYKLADNTNARDFSLSTWSQYFDTKRYYCQADNLPQPTPGYQHSLTDMLSFFGTLAETDPSFRVRVVDLETTVDLTMGKASIVANMESVGMPVGVARRTVDVYEFEKREEGRWMIVKQRSVAGMGSL